jgi:predicted DsbA family dithiol-disulfide isomerase
MSIRPAWDADAALPGELLDEASDGPVLEISFFHDVLCAWSYIADHRLERLRAEYEPTVRFRYRPFPLRPNEQAPNRKQRQVLARHYRRAAKEEEGGGVVDELWVGRDPPRCSLPPLLALEAALVQGPGAQRTLLRALRGAAFLRGVNVTRRDVLLELAQGASLDVDRFARDLDDPRCERAVEVSLAEASAIGIQGVPALILGGEWLLQGCREIDEYRRAIDKYLTERTSAPARRTLH